LVCDGLVLEVHSRVKCSRGYIHKACYKSEAVSEEYPDCEESIISDVAHLEDSIIRTSAQNEAKRASSGRDDDDLHLLHLTQYLLESDTEGSDDDDLCLLHSTQHVMSLEMRQLEAKRVSLSNDTALEKEALETLRRELADSELAEPTSVTKVHHYENSSAAAPDSHMQMDLAQLGLNAAEFQFGRRVYQCEVPAPGVGYRKTPSFSDKVPDGAGPRKPQVIIADAIVQGPRAAFIRCCSGKGWLPLTDPNGRRICFRHLDQEQYVDFYNLGLELADGEAQLDPLRPTRVDGHVKGQSPLNDDEDDDILFSP